MKKDLLLLCLMVFVLCGAMPVAAYSATYYVPDNYATIQAALSGVSNDDEVVLRDATYSGTDNKNLDFGGKSITLRSENGPENCIIDCEGSGRGFIFQNSETATSVIDGITIINGNQDSGVGGAIYCYQASPTISNCVLSGNSAIFGGAIDCDGSSPTIIGCSITGNSAQFGGAVDFWNLSSPTVSNCIINDNTATDFGGAIYCSLSSLANFMNCLIYGNSADFGGAVDCDYSSPTFLNCSFSDNSAGVGGAIHCDLFSNITVTNCILWGDSATTGPEIAIDSASYPSSISVSYSNVEGGSAAVYVAAGSTLTWGAGNIDADPLFVGGGDYHLTPGSPCIDVGADIGVYTDIENDLRPYGSGYDMGSDEHSFDSIGVYRGRWWYFDINGNRQWDAGGDRTFAFGMETDIPVIGDWNGDGIDDAGFFRDAYFYLDLNGDGAWGAGDVSFKFGQATDTPISGDWNGDGKDEVGFFRNAWFFLDANADREWNVATDVYFKFGQPTDVPITGDWNGDGIDEVGVFRDRWWYFDFDGNQQWNIAEDVYFKYGRATDLPITGDWQGDGIDEVGVFRDRWWYLDSNGNDMWDVGIDESFKFGLATDTPFGGRF